VEFVLGEAYELVNSSADYVQG